MADEDVVPEEHINDESDSKSKKSAKHDSGATDLEKITDHVEEVEINNRNISDVSFIDIVLSPSFVVQEAPRYFD